MSLTLTYAKLMLARLHHFWNEMNTGPQEDWDRVYLCSVAPMSAQALRSNEEAEHIHTTYS